ncbi:MAG: hypothetical protein P8J51_03670 [Dehalococcoidia bacterium]|jgi:hypothetical protein|nr:hypothetical protein [Dehalococcoidia bacterium]|tara:strand:- start:32 stop:556 length:525 start_codon:yes stop_codon:yes gene_type:complete
MSEEKTTGEEAWSQEKGLSDVVVAQYKSQILEFISNKNTHMAYLMSRRNNGEEIMRPVGTFVTDWTVETLTQDVQPKTNHIMNDANVGYLWVGKDTRDASLWNPYVVWMHGFAEIITDQDYVRNFYERRKAKTGVGVVHHDDGKTMHYVIKTIPKYIRAEGWHGRNAIVIKDFN